MKTDHLPNKMSILTPTQRRQRNREEMRNTILHTALEIMHEQGAGGLNLNELARRVHLCPSSLYVYFPSKMAIYDALYALGIRMFSEELERILQSIPDPWDALQAVIERTITLSVDRPEIFQICFERPIPGFEPSAESMAETSELTGKMYSLMERVLPADGTETHPDFPPAHGLFIAMWHGLTALHIANDPGLPAGSGRFGSLVPAAVQLFKTTWEKKGAFQSDLAEDQSE
jgi:AcrR family transcriptional regulator